MRNAPGYTLERPIGDEGSSGETWLATSEADGTRVAIKFLKDPHQIERFRREARILDARAGNPYVVRVLARDTDCASPYIVMEYAGGGSLAAWIEDRQPWQMVALAVSCAATGLTPLHEAGGFHRDLKPQNLLLVRSGDGWIVKVADFGLARDPVATSSKVTATAMGTRPYMAPEVLGGRRDHTAASDVFSLGTTAVQLLTGALFEEALDEVKDVPSGFTSLLRDMVNVLAHKRPTMAAVSERLRALGDVGGGRVVVSQGTATADIDLEPSRDGVLPVEAPPPATRPQPAPLFALSPSPPAGNWLAALAAHRKQVPNQAPSAPVFPPTPAPQTLSELADLMYDPKEPTLLGIFTNVALKGLDQWVKANTPKSPPASDRPPVLPRGTTAAAPKPVAAPTPAPVAQSWARLARDLADASQRSWWTRLKRMVAAVEADPAARTLLPRETHQPGDPGFLWSYADAPEDVGEHGRRAYRALKFFTRSDIPARIGDFRPDTHALVQVRVGNRWQEPEWADRRRDLYECFVEPLLAWLEPAAASGPGLARERRPPPDLHLRLLELEDEIADAEARGRMVPLTYSRNMWGPDHPGTFSAGFPDGQIVMSVGQTSAVPAEWAALILASHPDAFQVDDDNLPEAPRDPKPLLSDEELNRLRRERDRLRIVLGMAAAE